MPCTTDRISTQTQALTLQGGHQLTLTITGARSLPILLFVVGSSGLGKLYHRLAIELSAHFQCVYYDKRSFLSAPPSIQHSAKHRDKPVPTQRHADDAAAIILHLSPFRPVHVFGTSTGGTAVLDLLLRYPHFVRTAVLHEPIVFSVVPVEDGREEMTREYRHVAGIEDPFEALRVFTMGYMFTPRGAKAESKAESTPRQGERTESRPPQDWVKVHNARQTQLEATAMLDYVVDTEQARKLSNRIVLLAGVDSKELPVSVPGRALASVLGRGSKTWDVPGGHVSFAAKSHAAAFAKRLFTILQQEGTMLLTTGEERPKI